MEVFGTVTTAMGVLDQSRQPVSAIRERYRHMKRVPRKCVELGKGLNEMDVTLRELKEYQPESMTSVRERQVAKIFKYLENAKSILQEEELKTKASSRMRKFMQAKRVSETLDELVSGLEKLEVRGVLIDGFAAHQAAPLQSSCGVKEDSFVAQYNVPPIPESLVLDLNDSATYEGQLKQKVLNNSARTVGAVGARVTAAQGMSGVGKTCAVTAVGNDSDVQRCYSGGVYFLSFGQNATDGDVVSKVADKVEESGGRLLADKIRNENILGSAIEKARGWFSGYKNLFICDDMWRCKGRDSGYLPLMKRLCNEKDGGCVLLSTRDLQVSEELDSSSLVKLEERDNAAAVNMLCKYAEVRNEWVESGSKTVKNALGNVMRRCGGLPVALGVAGKGVRNIARRSGGDDAGEKERRLDAIVKYSEKLERSLHTQVGLGKKGYMDHCGLFGSLEISLKSGAEACKDGEEDEEWCLEKLHRGLCVLQKQAWAPVTMLSCLWDLEEEAVERVVDVMAELSICKVEDREVDGEEMMGIRIHDLVHEYCVLQAGKHEGVREWHEQVVEGYRRRYGVRAENDKSDRCVEWWSDEVEDDSYIHTNLTRHLAESGEVDELERLMLDYRWTMRQLSLNRCLGLESDFRELLRCGRQLRKQGEQTNLTGASQSHLHVQNRSSDSDKDGGKDVRGDGIELIMKTIRTSWSRVSANVGEVDFRQLSFQLIGRLSTAERKMAGVKRYLNSVREWTKKPWMVPQEGCLESVDEYVEEVYVGSAVFSIALLPEWSRIIVGVKSGMVSLVDVRLAEVVKRYVGHTGPVLSVAVSRDGRWMASGSMDGTVRRWDVEGGSGIGSPLVGHEGPVRSIAMNEDHDLIASGGNDGIVRLWRMNTGEVIGEPLWGHEEAVSSVALSSDGQHVVSCSDDKTIRVWSATTGKEVMAPLRGHKGPVQSVVTSRNNQYIVSGSADRTIRLWDMSSGREVREPLRGHQGPVLSVAVSEDCRVIASTSDEFAVRVWNIRMEEVVETVLRGHTHLVFCIARRKLQYLGEFRK